MTNISIPQSFSIDLRDPNPEVKTLNWNARPSTRANPGQSTGARRWKVVMKFQGLGGELNSSGVDESLERFASGN